MRASRYGLDDGSAKTYVKVGQIMGVPMSKVRSMEKTALESLRKPHFITRLEEFLDANLD